LPLAGVVALGLGALRRALDQRLYRRHVRPLFLDAMVALGVGPTVIALRMRPSMGRYRRIAEGDAPLAMIGEIASHFPTEAGGPQLR
jgi:O-antigen ligase